MDLRMARAKDGPGSLAGLAGLVLFRRCWRPLWLARFSAQIGPDVEVSS